MKSSSFAGRFQLAFDHLPQLIQLASQIAEILLLLDILLLLAGQFASAFVLYHIDLSLVVHLLIIVRLFQCLLDQLLLLL